MVMAAAVCAPPKSISIDVTRIWGAAVGWHSQNQESVRTVGANTESIPWRNDREAACGHGNRFCLPSPPGAASLEQFVLAGAALCTA